MHRAAHAEVRDASRFGSHIGDPASELWADGRVGGEAARGLRPLNGFPWSVPVPTTISARVLREVWTVAGLSIIAVPISRSACGTTTSGTSGAANQRLDSHTRWKDAPRVRTVRGRSVVSGRICHHIGGRGPTNAGQPDAGRAVRVRGERRADTCRRFAFGPQGPQKRWTRQVGLRPISWPVKPRRVCRASRRTRGPGGWLAMSDQINANTARP